ncbi:hypothetical protein [Mesorhizobium sp. M1273]|uniref:hypothetical protein n=1 Tax=Mesorhizobium sp. M1273 TaxID=2957075 RepID=UPI0033380BC1
MRQLQFTADQQTRTDWDITDPGNQGSLESVTSQQLAKAGGVIFERPCGAIKKGGKAQLRDCLNIALAHRFDCRLHLRPGGVDGSPAFAKTKPPGPRPAVRNQRRRINTGRHCPTCSRAP